MYEKLLGLPLKKRLLGQFSYSAIIVFSPNSKVKKHFEALLITFWRTKYILGYDWLSYEP